MTDEKSPLKLASGAVSQDLLARFVADFASDDKHRLALNAVTRSGFIETAIDRNRSVELDHTFSVRIPNEAKATNQKSSGRCWIFAALNVMRHGVAKAQNIDELELSQPFLFFWDKFEKSNFFLETILSTMNEKVEDRLLSYLIHAPVNDGGQYDMLVNIVQKYGVVPKKAFPETHHSGNSGHLNWVITYRLREAALLLRTLHREGKSIEELRAVKAERLSEIYRILCIFLGQPPKTFDWTFQNKDKKHTRVANLTPLEFVDRFVPLKVADQVSLINDPRNEYYRLYTVEYLGNVVGGRPVLYVNVPIDQLKRFARATLEKGQPVWFGCDVGKLFHREAGVMDPKYFDYELTLGTRFNMSKADRLRYGESLMTHAMVFTGVDVVDDKPLKWRVENSWGDANGDKGFLVMSDAWFDEYMYQVVIDRALLPEEITSVLAQEPTRLPAWDPMGSLA